jgi:hypothetical protein
MLKNNRMPESRLLMVTADGSHTLAVPELNETYLSTYGAIQESRHVFIKSELVYNARGQN